MQVFLGTRPSQPRIGHVELVARITDSVQSSPARHPLLMWICRAAVKVCPRTMFSGARYSTPWRARYPGISSPADRTHHDIRRSSPSHRGHHHSRRNSPAHKTRRNPRSQRHKRPHRSSPSHSLRLRSRSTSTMDRHKAPAERRQRSRNHRTSIHLL